MNSCDERPCMDMHTRKKPCRMARLLEWLHQSMQKRFDSRWQATAGLCRSLSGRRDSFDKSFVCKKNNSKTFAHRQDS